MVYFVLKERVGTSYTILPRLGKWSPRFADRRFREFILTVNRQRSIDLGLDGQKTAVSLPFLCRFPDWVLTEIPVRVRQRCSGGTSRTFRRARRSRSVLKMRNFEFKMMDFSSQMLTSGMKGVRVVLWQRLPQTLRYGTLRQVSAHFLNAKFIHFECKIHHLHANKPPCLPPPASAPRIGRNAM